MKVITIGRDRTQDICYDNEMISRRHAILRIYSNGKMEIVSLGQNGTFVNGNLCKPNAHYPLKRNDVVSFAHVCELDWSEIPNPLRWLKITSLIVGVLGVLAVILVFSYDKLPFGKNNIEDEIEWEKPNETTEIAPNNWSNKLPGNKGILPDTIEQEENEKSGKEKETPKAGAKENEKDDSKIKENGKFKKYFKNKKQPEKKKQEKKQEKNDSTTPIGNIFIG